jgi:thiol-disulfide isomerase/thioredoxin
MAGRAGAILAWTAIASFAALSAGLGWWIGLRHHTPAPPLLPEGLVVVEPGQPVPPMRLPELRSGVLEPLAAPGRPRLLNYWASWCGPCRKEMPLLDAFAQSQDGVGVEVVGIALEPAEDALAFLDQVPVRFLLLQETPGPGDSSVRLGNRRGLLPFTALLDRDGRLLKVHVGPFPSEAAVAAWANPP